MSKRLFAVLGVSLLVLAFIIPVGASSAQAPIGPSVANSSRFRVVIAGGLPTQADVWVDGAVSTISGLMAAKSYDASGYVNSTGGPHTIQLYETGTMTPMPGVPTYSVTLTANLDYSLVLLSDNLTWMQVQDLNPVPAPNTANARVFNLSANPSTSTVSVLMDGLPVTQWANIAYLSTSSYASIDTTVINHTLSMLGAVNKVYFFQDAHVYTIFIFWAPNTKGVFSPVILPQTDSNLAPHTLTPTGSVLPPTSTPSTPVPTGTVVGPPNGPMIYLPIITR